VVRAGGVKINQGQNVEGQNVEGQNVILSCNMDYYYRSPADPLVNPGVIISASVSWETAAGTFIANSSTELRNNKGDRVGESLQTHVWLTVTGTEMPSYKCTTSFQFSARDTTSNNAVNSLSYDCISRPVPVSRKFVMHICKC